MTNFISDVTVSVYLYTQQKAKMLRKYCSHMSHAAADHVSFWMLRLAAIRVLQIVLVARMVLADEWIAAHVRAGRWRHRQLWLGTAAAGRRRHLRERLRRPRSADAAAADRDIEMGKT